MEQFLLFGINVFFFLLVLVIIVLFIEFQAKNKLQQQLQDYFEQQQLLLYELTVLKNIQENNQSRLDVEKVIDVVVHNLDSLVPYSLISSLILKHDKIIFKIIIKEPVNHTFLESIKASTKHSLTEVTDMPLPFNMEEQVTGILAGDFPQNDLSSFFHIPLLVNEKAVAIITIASTKLECYSLDQMMLIQRVVDLASRSLSGLEMVMTVEKGKLTAMIGSLGDGLFMVDTNNQVVVINTAAREILRTLKDNLTLFDMLSALPQQYDFGSKIQKAISHNESFEEKEVVIGEKFFQIRIFPILNVSDPDTPGVIGVSVLLHDITLEKSVSKMKEDFTHVMVHELRSPLTSIKASSKMLITMPSLASDDKTKFLNMIYDQSSKLLETVSLILDAAKLEAGVFTIEKMQSDIKTIIQERITIFTPMAKEKSINLYADIETTLPPFSFDPHHIDQVLNNLISNSMKFTPTGGTICISAKKIPDKVIVSVSDTGAGIPKDKQHLLFSKFSQISTSQSHKGTGIGLYFAKGVVESHGGTISLESEEGKGTTVSFSLPLIMQKPAEHNLDILPNTA